MHIRDQTAPNGQRWRRARRREPTMVCCTRQKFDNRVRHSSRNRTIYRWTKVYQKVPKVYSLAALSRGPVVRRALRRPVRTSTVHEIVRGFMPYTRCRLWGILHYYLAEFSLHRDVAYNCSVCWYGCNQPVRPVPVITYRTNIKSNEIILIRRWNY